MAGLKDVADAAGVSMSVASRVLTADAKARIHPETRQRVLAVAAEIGYVPSHRARALRMSRAGALALIVPDVSNAVFAPLLAGVDQVAKARSVSVLLGQLNGPRAGRQELAALVGRGRVDGAVLQRREDFTDRMLASLLDIDVPVVLFNSRLEGHTGSVLLDDGEAARIATQHLLDLGHERLGFIGGTTRHDAAVRRLRAFRATMRAAGHPVGESAVVAAGWEAEAGATAAKRLLDTSSPPTGFVVASVNAALGAVSHAGRAGIRVPEELSVVAVQDTWMAEVYCPPLTVVRMPLQEAGAAATAMLLDHIDGSALTDQVLSAPVPELVVRGSTGQPSTP
ncbi:LacI family DNA-binding transcriptional regulator [Streptomyces sasae]|uniref:LacI family DNA-binding transcriptional regulator n=1 Tax=Streptomyces sasae TaxID=1266772 RepID=UPI00292E8706|nr:LacI family DNA-binding transcriptional regulator [Streptomyces sasae]